MGDNDKFDTHWQIVNSGGIQTSLTPEQLWENATNYFRWCDNHPIKTKRTLTSGKTQGSKVEVEHTRPYTIEAMCLHCGISKKYIKDIQDSADDGNAFFMVVEKILSIIYTQNLEGGITDIYNPIMVSKVLNLDKTTNDGNESRAVKVEIVRSESNVLKTSEHDIIKNLDYSKVEILNSKIEEKEKSENSKDERQIRENLDEV